MLNIVSDLVNWQFQSLTESKDNTAEWLTLSLVQSTMLGWLNLEISLGKVSVYSVATNVDGR